MISRNKQLESVHSEFSWPKNSCVFSQEKRWGREKERIPGPSDYYIDHSKQGKSPKKVKIAEEKRFKENRDPSPGPLDYTPKYHFVKK